MTLTDTIELNIRAFKAEHGCMPTHIFLPASVDLPDSLVSYNGVVVIQLFDPAVKHPLTARCSSYAQLFRNT